MLIHRRPSRIKRSQRKEPLTEIDVNASQLRAGTVIDSVADIEKLVVVDCKRALQVFEEKELDKRSAVKSF